MSNPRNEEENLVKQGLAHQDNGNELLEGAKRNVPDTMKEVAKEYFLAALCFQQAAKINNDNQKNSGRCSAAYQAAEEAVKLASFDPKNPNDKIFLERMKHFSENVNQITKVKPINIIDNYEQKPPLPPRRGGPRS